MPRFRLGRRHLACLVLACLMIVMGLAACSGDDTPVAPLEDDQTTVPTLTPRPTFTPAPSATPTEAATATPMPTETPVPTPTLDPNVNPLTGLVVDDPSVLDLRPLAVRVGNDPVARPQDGLAAADVVWEEVMEGYTVTRYTAIIYGEQPERLRPIRSARLSSIQIAPMYDAALAHSGASDEIRWRISQATFVNLDEFFTRTGYHYLGGDWRTRLYADPAELHGYLADEGLERSEPIHGYAFDAAAPEGSSGQSVSIPYPSTSAVEWVYNGETGVYERWVMGLVHADGLTGEQLTAENVVVLYAEHRATDIVEDINGSTAIDIQLTGSGDAVLMRDGVAISCEWRRPEDGGLIECYSEDGELVPLKPGHTWIQLVPLDYEVVFE